MSDDGPRSSPSSSGPEHDAWLREALRHAPDASASPPPSLREAILAEARAAARAGSTRQPAASASLLERALAFWSWLARPQVAAGFASVMAATLVGMLWWDRPMDETMLPAPSSPTAQRVQEPGPVPHPAASETRSPSASADRADPRLAERQRSLPPSTAGAELRDTAPAPAQTAPPRAAADTAAMEAARQPPVTRETADERARSAADAKPMAKAEEAKAARKDDRLLQAPPSSAATAPTITAATPATPGTLRPAAEAPTPFPAKSPAEVDAATRPAAPVATPRPASPPPPAPSPAPPAPTPLPSPEVITPPAVATAPSPAAPSGQQPAPALAQGRAEPFSLAKKAESGEKEGAAAKARATPTTPAARAPAPAGALGAALDNSEAGATGRVAAENATAAELRQRAASVAPSTRPMAPLLAALASEELRWSRRLASGESAAVDAALRTWLAQVQSAAPRWEAAVERGARRDAPAGSSSATILRLERDGRPSAVVQVEDGGVLFDPLSGSPWFAPLPPDVVARLRATLPPAPR